MADPLQILFGPWRNVPPHKFQMPVLERMREALNDRARCTCDICGENYADHAHYLTDGETWATAERGFWVCRPCVRRSVAVYREAVLLSKFCERA